MASSESQARLTQTEPAKWIVVYKNGDQHFAGRRMVVKPREIKTFDHLLEEVTVKLSPSFGAVRNIFTPEGGTRVSSLTDLKPNGKYVASPNEPFRKLSRTRYGEIPVQSTSTSQSRASLQPVKDKQAGATSGGRWLHTVSSRYRESGTDELTIHVYRNGDAFSAASPLRVDRLARSHWQETLSRLGEKLRMGRAVHKLYTLKGQLVRDPATDLEHNGLYVAAADNESFRLVNYGATREPFKSVTRGDRYHSLCHYSLHQPPPRRVRRQLPRPPPRGVAVAPIDIAPGAIPPAAESDSAPSFSSSSTDVEDGSAMDALYPEFPQKDVESSRPEPFYLHPLPESVEEGLVGRGGGRSWESDNMERRPGSALTSADDERWPDDGYEAEPGVHVVTDPPAVPLPGDLATSYSAPHLSQPPSREDSGEGTPSPSDPRMAGSHLSRPSGSGFHSAGYSPLPEPRECSGSDTPYTPPFGAIDTTDRSSGRLAVGGGSRAASRAASEPRIDSRFNSETPEPSACETMPNSAGQFRCASVLSQASSVPEAVCESPMSLEFSPPLMHHPAPRDTLRAPVSGGESPAGVSSGRTTPVSTSSDADGAVPVVPEDGDVIPYWSARSRHSPLTLVRQEFFPQPMAEEELSSEENISATNDNRSGSGTSGDPSEMAVSSRRSSATPELRRPLLAHPVYRNLELPHDEPSSPVTVSAASDAGAEPAAGQTVPAVELQPSGPTPGQRQVSGSGPQPARVEGRGNRLLPPPVSLEERATPRAMPPTHQRHSVSEGSPLSWSGTAGGTGWVWDEIPARPSDRTAIAQMAPPPAQMAPPAPPAPAAAAAVETAAVAPSQPSQLAWPPTRTNTPEQAVESSPEPDEDPEPAKPELVPETGSEPSAVPRSSIATLTGGGAESALGTEAGEERVPRDIGQKLDEIASLLRTLLLQNVAGS